MWHSLKALGSFGVLRYCWSAKINYSTDLPEVLHPSHTHSSPVIVQYLYIGPDTIQSAQRRCTDESVAQVKGKEVRMGFQSVQQHDFLIG